MARCVPHPDPLVERNLVYYDTAAPDLKVISHVVGQKATYFWVCHLYKDGSEVEVLILVGHHHCFFEISKRHILDHFVEELL